LTQIIIQKGLAFTYAKLLNWELPTLGYLLHQLELNRAYRWGLGGPSYVQHSLLDPLCLLSHPVLEKFDGIAFPLVIDFECERRLDNLVIPLRL
jgi:hypothetical protein